MDNFRFIFKRRLNFFVAFFFFLPLLLVSTASHANTLAGAMSACNYDITNNGYQQNVPDMLMPWTCKDIGKQANGSYYVAEVKTDGSYTLNWFVYDYVAVNPCDPASHPPITYPIWTVQPLLNDYSVGAQTADPNNPGAYVSCGDTISVNGASSWDPSHQEYMTDVTTAYSGNLADGSTWKDSAGANLSPQPSVTNLPTVDVSVPAICSGSSCYQASSDAFTADSSTGNMQVSGSDARGSGSCSSTSGAALCAGAPGTIPAPPAAIIPDPATQIQGTATYQQVDPSTGAMHSVTVTVYAGAGTTTSSGQQPTDSGPAPASTAPTAASGFVGGTDCNTPPVCTGDAAICGIARTQWATTCQVHTDLTGPTGKAPSTFAADSTKYTQSDVIVPASTGNTTGDQANNGIYDLGGFGIGTTCPLKDVQFSSIPFVVKLSDGCDVLRWSGNLILIFALFAAARITAGSSV